MLAHLRGTALSACLDHLAIDASHQQMVAHLQPAVAVVLHNSSMQCIPQRMHMCLECLEQGRLAQLAASG